MLVNLFIVTAKKSVVFITSMYLNYLLIWILCIISVYINSHLFLLYYTHKYVERSNHCLVLHKTSKYIVCGTDDWTQRPVHARLSLSFFSLLNHSNTLFCESVSLNFPLSHLVASFLSLSSTWATRLLFFFLSFLKITFIYVSIYLFNVWGLCVRVCVWVSVCVCMEVREQLVRPGSFLIRGGSQN